jgi:predicted MPP superfamily phosphohydrolase
MFGVTELTVPVLPRSAQPMRVLHLSDLHLTINQRRKIDWLSGLAEHAAPDLTVVTGDFLAHPQAVPVVLDALGGLLDRPGAFVLGSNDYYAPRQVNPAAYLLRPSDLDEALPALPWGDLVAGLREAGWLNLNNDAASAVLGSQRIPVALRGVDDPHIGRDRYDAVAGPFPAEAVLRIGVTHAPYLRVLDGMAGDGADLIFAGHTHGGQVCWPGGRAIVTNCDIDPARAKGLSRHRVGQQHADDRAAGAYLHVSQGLGTAPSAPIRLFCPPRATILTLVPRE